VLVDTRELNGRHWALTAVESGYRAGTGVALGGVCRRHERHRGGGHLRRGRLASRVPPEQVTQARHRTGSIGPHEGRVLRARPKAARTRASNATTLPVNPAESGSSVLEARCSLKKSCTWLLVGGFWSEKCRATKSRSDSPRKPSIDLPERSAEKLASVKGRSCRAATRLEWRMLTTAPRRCPL